LEAIYLICNGKINGFFSYLNDEKVLSIITQNIVIFNKIYTEYLEQQYLSFIHYSNTFTPYLEKLNISCGLYANLKNMFEAYKPEKSIFLDDLYNIEQINRQYPFIRRHGDKIPFNFPNGLAITYNKELYVNLAYQANDTIKNILELILPNINSSFLENIIFNILLGIITSLDSRGRTDDLKLFENSLKDVEFKNIRVKLEYLFSPKSHFYKINFYQDKEYQLKKINRLIKFIEKHQNSIKNNILLLENEDDILEIRIIINNLRPKIYPPIKFCWAYNAEIGYLSSGEEAFINLFANLYDEKQKKVILIDEGELGMHPNWQKKYLDYLIKVFGNRKIQIILTSHSPFLVSDLPKENIIFLRKGEEEDGELENKCIVVKEGDRKHPQITQTFGQNIHTLFADSFFMEGGLMGEFAKEKIKNVLIDITGNQEVTKGNESRKKEIEFIISQIGEPLLRKKLEKIYQQNFLELEEEEKQLKQRLAEITKLKNDKK
jgi:predicted ATPase